MLNITRRENEAILIFPDEAMDPHMTVAELFANGPIWIGTRNFNGNQVKVCIEAPRSLTVLREERLEKPPIKK